MNIKVSDGLAVHAKQLYCTKHKIDDLSYSFVVRKVLEDYISKNERGVVIVRKKKEAKGRKRK